MFKLNNLFIFWKFSVFFQANTTSNLTIIVMHSGITCARVVGGNKLVYVSCSNCQITTRNYGIDS